MPWTWPWSSCSRRTQLVVELWHYVSRYGGGTDMELVGFLVDFSFPAWNFCFGHMLFLFVVYMDISTQRVEQHILAANCLQHGIEIFVIRPRTCMELLEGHVNRVGWACECEDK